ncbi:MAG TPA: DUF115 domain-containing protein [Sandaracinaceae bacterium LLY-WYZ-13_1]|nr:DUF115 domain-containing protein [Sandaracinaceae bacterium LLY-WYZ-13_1]
MHAQPLPPVRPELVDTPAGLPSLRYGAEPLEDPVDPVEGAERFVRPDVVARARHVVLFGAGLGYRVARLRALGCTPVVFEPCPAVLDLARRHGPGLPEDVPVFTDPRALHGHLMAVSRPDEHTVLLCAPPLKRAFPAEAEAVARVIEEVQGLVLLRRNSVAERSAMMTERALSNLPRAARVPGLGALSRPLDGIPAFLVAAGPSLDANRHLLEAASRRGAVFAVNTSAPVLAAIDAPIDVLVAIEALDVSEPMQIAAGVTRALALDLTAHPANFAVPVDRKLAFLADAPQYRRLGERLGLGPLGYGGSVATAAFALAARLGADPIVLLGQDLAYTGGRGYASDTLYEGTAVHREGRLLRIERAATFEAIQRSGGLGGRAKHRPCVDVPAWGGGTVWSTHELTLFRRWFEMAAHQLKGRRRLVNATEGGASIEGYEERRLEALLDELPERAHGLHAAIDEAAPVDVARVDEIAREIRASARALSKAATRCAKASKRGRPRALELALEALRAAARDAPLAEAHASSELTTITGDDTLAPAERERRTFAAIRRSADRVARLAR